MTPAVHAYIRGQLDGMVDLLRATNPSLTREEIYAAIIERVEFMRKTWPDPQSQQQMGDKGPFNSAATTESNYRRVVEQTLKAWKDPFPFNSAATTESSAATTESNYRRVVEQTLKAWKDPFSKGDE